MGPAARPRTMVLQHLPMAAVVLRARWRLSPPLGVEHLAIQRRRGAGLRGTQLLVDRTQQRPPQIHIETRLMEITAHMRSENRRGRGKRSEGEATAYCRSKVAVVVIGDAGAVRNGDGQTAAHVGIRNPGISVETLGEVTIRI